MACWHAQATLRLENALIEEARALAADRGVTLSELFGRLLRARIGIELGHVHPAGRRDVGESRPEMSTMDGK